MFEDDQKPSYLVRKLDLGPKSPVFPFNVEFLLLAINNCNHTIMGLVNFFHQVENVQKEAYRYPSDS